MHEHGVVEASDDELHKYARDVQRVIHMQAGDGA
jgi:hypothetical protein